MSNPWAHCTLDIWDSALSLADNILPRGYYTVDGAFNLADSVLHLDNIIVNWVDSVWDCGSSIISFICYLGNSIVKSALRLINSAFSLAYEITSLRLHLIDSTLSLGDSTWNLVNCAIKVAAGTVSRVLNSRLSLVNVRV